MAQPYYYHRQQQQQQQDKRKTNSTTTRTAPAMDVKRMANMYMNKLSDRDTEAMAASELESMARSLPSDSIPSFLSAISDTRSTDKTPLRRHCVRLLSLLSQSHPPHSLTPLLPRMISAVRSRLRDPDTSVRDACVHAVRSIAAAAAASSNDQIGGSVIVRPLVESLLLEQDHNAQIGSAMCLAAAVEGLGFTASSDLQRLVPRLVKLSKTDAFKAKPALLSLFGAVIASGGALTPSALGTMVPCLIEFLSSEDWATRKAAAEALSRVASISDTHLLSSFKSSCISSYESRRFDKVKIVRDSMNRMLEAWKNLPGSCRDDDHDHGGGGGGGGGVSKNASNNSQSSSSVLKETSGDRHFPRISEPVRSNISQVSATKNRPSSSRSPPEASPTLTSRRNASPSSGKRTSSPPSRKLERKKPSDWNIEISVPQAHTDKLVFEDKQGGHGSNRRFHLEPKRILFEDISQDTANKFSSLKPGARVSLPLQEKESSRSVAGASTEVDDLHMNQKENNDLSLIRNQLSQIENQQSSLLDLLQRYIRSSQNGIRSLETRVHGLEMALDEISQDLAVSTGKMPGPSSNACCKLPGAEFLSSRFWRKTEGKYSSRLSISSSSAVAGMRSSVDKESSGSFKWERKQLGVQGGFIVNPLAEVGQPRGCSDASSNRVANSVMHDSECSSVQDNRLR